MKREGDPPAGFASWDEFDAWDRREETESLNEIVLERQLKRSTLDQLDEVSALSPRQIRMKKTIQTREERRAALLARIAARFPSHRKP